MPAIGSPGHAEKTELWEKIQRRLSRRLAVKSNYIDLGSLRDIALDRRAVEEDFRAVRRPARVIAEGRYLTLLAAEDRRYEQSSAIALGAEDQTVTLGRPIGLPVM